MNDTGRTQSISTRPYVDKKGVYYPYTAGSIANFFIDQYEADPKKIHPMTCLRVNKLVYVAFGWTAANTERYLFEDRIEAWDYGPVIPNLYHQFKRYGSSPVEGRALDTEYDLDGNISLYYPVSVEKGDDEFLHDLLVQVYEGYEEFSNGKLIDRTHTEGTPWSIVYHPNIRSIEIDKDLIKRYYIELLKVKAS